MGALDCVNVALEFHMAELQSQVRDLCKLEHARTQFHEARGVQGG